MADRILVTGANGFIGSALCPRLRKSGFLVRGAVRAKANTPAGRTSEFNGLQWVILHDRSTENETDHALGDVHTVIHLAARVHVMTDRAADPLREFRRVNLDWTKQLATVAASRAVRRFVYLSSIKVNGEQSSRPFTEMDAPKPQDAYGISKWEAEQALVEISAKSAMETVILRSPLVYGPGVGGNFLQLLKILQRGIPLPLASVRNRRSLVYRGNLIDALCCCIRDRRAAGQTYLVSDGEDLSTPELIRRLGAAMGVNPRLWPFPTEWLCWAGRIVGKGGTIDRLVGSLQVDSSKIRQELGWQPTFSIDRGLLDTAEWFRTHSAGC